MTPSTSASTDRPGPLARGPLAQGPLAQAWAPAGAIYLAVMTAGLAAGLWPQAIHASKSGLLTAPPPALAAVAVAQVGYLLLIHPLVLLRRAPAPRYWAARVVESAAYLVAGAPFYVVAAWMSDAVVADVVRTAACMACLWPVTWAAGRWLQQVPKARPTVTLLLLIAALGLPATYYLVREFVSPQGGSWLWSLAPATLAWDNAASRLPGPLPRPAWALGVWLAVALAAAMLRRAARPCPDAER